MKSILELITTYREQRGWSEYQLAERSGLPQSTISSQNRGARQGTVLRQGMRQGTVLCLERNPDFYPMMIRESSIFSVFSECSFQRTRSVL
ncbi:MAG: helix-turn-helix transcriptional regulator [Ruminococcaceae bacterium]|nr:helix-turn-helix transcriptional regulator [Oscillospiraceae bacterium]